jgi:hypothetical protein
LLIFKHLHDIAGANFFIASISVDTRSIHANLRHAYKSKRIIKQYKGLDREGLVLLAILSGGDYDKAGLPRYRTDKALKGAAYGLS